MNQQSNDRMTYCAVPGCNRPSDGWFVCANCGIVASNALLDFADWLLDDLQLVITRQTRYTQGGGRSKSATTPLMFNDRASDHAGGVAMFLDTAARMISEDNQWEADYSDAAGAARWLEHRMSAIRLHVDGGETVDGILAWHVAIKQTIDRPVPRQFLGDCKAVDEGQVCPGRIYGREGKPEARCDTCGATHQADELRGGLLSELEGRLVSASEAARLATYLGIPLDREQVRKRINQWAKRGRIMRHDREGEQVFRFGEIHDRLAEEEARRAGDKAS